MLNFINVSDGNIVGLTKISENDYKLYKLKASSSSSIDLDFRKIFEIGDYFILK